MTNQDAELSKTIGLTSSMIYKIRKGERHPSVRAMIEIENKLGWSLNEQIMARKAGKYHEAFVAAAKYEPELGTVTRIYPKSA